MQPAEPNQFDVGVLVGRFQVHELHAGHRELLDHVVSNHDKVIIFLGNSPLPVSTNNPLDFEARKQMLLAKYPRANVLYVPDQATNEGWSAHLDDQIGNLVTPGQSVVLYGGRDSFIDRYSGKYPTQELLQSTHYSGRAQRKAIAKSAAKASPEFRAGVIWASQSRHPTVYTTLDVAILKSDPLQLLLGRKPRERLFRFIGGFSSPSDDSFESGAKREVREETGLEVADLELLGSLNIDDWRYRDEPDCIRTLFYAAKYVYGRPVPADDIEEVRWIDLPPCYAGDASADPQFDNHLVPEHRPLMAMLRQHLVNRKES